MELTPEEGRVLGCLVEKQLTTPQQYPLTDNALVAACNQSTSRDPVVSFDLATVRVAVRSLRQAGLLRTVHRPGERSDKHQHEIPAALGLPAEEVALLAVLLLRGPQTPGELRIRSERMHPFGSVDAVVAVLESLVARGLAVRLDRLPGHKEARYAETLVAGESLPPPDPDSELLEPAAPHVQVQPRPASPSPLRLAPPGLADEVAELRAEVEELRAELAELRAELGGLRG